MHNLNLREELVALDRSDPELKAEFERRLSQMMEIELKPSYRTGWIVSGVITSVTSIYYAVVMALTWHAVDWPVRTAFAATCIASAVWGAMCTSIVRRNRLIRRVHMPWGVATITSLAYVLFVMAFMQAGWYTQSPFAGNLILFGGLSVLIAAAVVIVLFRMEQSTVRIEEELLRTQLQIAEMASEPKRAKPE